MQVRQGQGQARAGSQTHRKTTTKSTKKLTSPWTRKDFDDQAIKAQINEMQKQYVRLHPTYTRTHTYTLIFNDPPPADTLKTLWHWVISQSMFGFLKLQTWNGERDQKET